MLLNFVPFVVSPLFFAPFAFFAVKSPVKFRFCSKRSHYLKNLPHFSSVAFSSSSSILVVRGNSSIQ